MLYLYYSSDQGLLDQKTKSFLIDNPNVKTVIPNSYSQFFDSLAVDIFTQENQSYYLPNAWILSKNYALYLDTKTTSSVHNRTVDDWISYILSLAQHHNIMICVRSDELVSTPCVKNLLTKTHNSDHLLVKWSTNQINEYISGWFDQNDIHFDQYIDVNYCDIFPTDLHQINMILSQILLLNKKNLSYSDLLSLVGDNYRVNYYSLVDYYLKGNKEWIRLLHDHCFTNDHAESLWHIFVYKFTEFYHYVHYKNDNWRERQICSLMKKSMYQLNAYDRAYQYNRKLVNKINNVLDTIIDFSVQIRTNVLLSVQTIKSFLINL